MKVLVKYFGIPKEFFSGQGQYLELPQDSTIETLLSVLSTKMTTKEYERLKMANFLVNHSLGEKHTVLHNGDVVRIMQIMGGG